MNADRRVILCAMLAGGAVLSFPVCSATSPVPDPVLGAIERHRQAYDALMEVWGQNSVSALYEAAKTDESAASELQRFRMVELAEEAAFSALLATMPTTKAGAVACVEHVAECGLATDEMRAWLGMLLDSPLVATL